MPPPVTNSRLQEWIAQAPAVQKAAISWRICFRERRCASSDFVRIDRPRNDRPRLREVPGIYGEKYACDLERQIMWYCAVKGRSKRFVNVRYNVLRTPDERVARIY